MKLILPNIKYLHIIRGVAALLVVVFHSKFVLWVGGTLYNKEKGLHTFGDYFLFILDMLSSCGTECMVIFFILSAFVIKHSFLNRHYSWGNFYTIRLIRIYWPFIASLLLSITALLVSVKYINPNIYTTGLREYNTRIIIAYDGLSFSQVIRTCFFIENGEFSGSNYAYWSLGHELIFYLLFPLYNILNKYALVIAGILLGTAFLLTGSIIFYYQIFFIGGLLLYDYFFNKSTGPVIKNKIVYGIVLACFYVAVNIVNKVVSEKFSDMVTLLYAFFIFDYILYFIKRKNVVLMKLGDISYSLYLNHLPLLMLYYSLLTLYTGKLIFYSRIPYYSGVIVAVLFTIPLYLFIEKPSIAFLKKWRK